MAGKCSFLPLIGVIIIELNKLMFGAVLIGQGKFFAKQQEKGVLTHEQQEVKTPGDCNGGLHDCAADACFLWREYGQFIRKQDAQQRQLGRCYS